MRISQSQSGQCWLRLAKEGALQRRVYPFRSGRHNTAILAATVRQPKVGRLDLRAFATAAEPPCLSARFKTGKFEAVFPFEQNQDGCLHHSTRDGGDRLSRWGHAIALVMALGVT